jgi:hypothetical protein
MEEKQVKIIDEKTIKSLLKCCNSTDKSQRKIKENFRFTLLKLLNNDKEKTKIENAYRNRKQWAENSIQNIALNSLQDLFFNIVDMYKEQPAYRDDNEHYYLKEKILQTILSSYFEDKKELEDEIEELQEKLDGKDMVTQEQYNNKVKELKDQNNIQVNHIEKLEQKLKDKEEYYKLKLSATEQRMRGKLEMEKKIQLSLSTD